jgi:hypothetical protein
VKHRLGPGCALVALLCWTACAADQVRYQTVGALPATTDRVTATLYLVGDGGEVNTDRDAVLAHLAADIEAVARDGAGPPVVVAFLGDNIYDDGATALAAPADVEKLAGQVLAIGDAPNVRGVFLPGNHDWANGASMEDGREAVERQREWVASMADARNVRFLPDDGCPGPATEDVGESIHLVYIDTEWLLRDPGGRCGSAADFYARLAEDLRANRDRVVVVLSHHPLASGGPHGGNVALLERGPLVYYLAAKSGVSRQDLGSPAYSAMRRGIGRAIEESGAPPLVHAAGHDHTLQVIRLAGPGEPGYQLVSGALAKSENARRIDGTRYATNGFGYMRLEFVGTRVIVSVFARDVTGGPVRPMFGCTLSRGAPAGECPEAPRVVDGA